MSLATRLKRLGLLAGMALTTINVWTGGPLLALWAGSRVQAQGPPSMGAFGLVAVTLLVISLLLVRLLALLDAWYGRLAGRQVAVRDHLPWLRSMRGERAEHRKRASELSPLEVILVVSVVAVVVIFEVWFFFFSTSPIDARSGRG